jgi:hypothetical protein
MSDKGIKKLLPTVKINLCTINRKDTSTMARGSTYVAELGAVKIVNHPALHLFLKSKKIQYKIKNNKTPVRQHD